MPMEPLRTYRRQGYCESCSNTCEHVFFEETFPLGGVKLQIKRVCQTCYAKGYKTFRTDGSIQESGVWRDD